MNKKVIICLCLLLFVLQSVVAEYRHKLQTINLAAYVGTWVYKTTGETFYIYLKKGYKDISYIYGDCLIGDYSYVKDGVKLDSYNAANLPDSITVKNLDAQIIGASNARTEEGPLPNCLMVVFKDKRYNKVLLGTIELLSPTQIHLKLQDVEGEYDSDEDMPIEGFSIPNDVTLTKVTPKIVGRPGRK